VARARTLVLKTQVEVTGADKLNNLGKKMQTVGRNLTVGVTLPLVAAGGALVAMAEEAARADAELKRTFDSMGAGAFTTVDALKQTQKQLQSTTTFADEEISHLQSVLLTFGNVTGDAFDRATEAALDMSALLGQDLQTSAIQLGKALNDPITGLAALRRVGVSFTEQQKDQIKVMTEAGDVAAAQGIILSEVERQFGGAAEALAETAGGQLKQALNELSDAGEEFGAIIAPVLADVAGSVTDLARELKKLSPETKEFIIKLGLILAAAGPVLVVVGGIARAVGTLAPFAARLSKFAPLLTALAAAARLASGDVKDLGNNLGDFLLEQAAGFDPFGIIGGIQTAATNLEADLIEPVHDAGLEWAESWAAIQDSAFDGTLDTADAIADGTALIEEEMEALADAVSPGQLADSIRAGIGDYNNALEELADATVTNINDLESRAQIEASLASKTLTDALNSDSTRTRLQALELVNDLVADYELIAPGALDAGTLVNPALTEGLYSNLGLVTGAANSIAATVEAPLAGMNAYPWGFQIGDSLARGMWDSMHLISNAAYEMANRVSRSVRIESEPPDPNSPLHGITKWGGNLVKTYADSMLHALPSMAGATTALARAGVIGGSAMSPTALAGGSGSSTVINNFYLQWDGESPKGRDEAEIIANLRRLLPIIDGKLAAGY
jgi:hypothetical protein